MTRRGTIPTVILYLAMLACFAAPRVQQAETLGQRLVSYNPNVRQAALKEARAADSHTKAELVPFLATELRNHQRWVRFCAAQALAALGPQGIPALVKALYDPDGNVRDPAERALGKIGRPAIPALIPVLRQPDVHARCSAATALGWMYSAGSPAVPDLVKMLRNPDPKVRRCAAGALGMIGSPRAVPGLRALLSDPDSQVRLSAMTSLSFIKPPPRGAVPDVIKMLKDPNSFIRLEAPLALGTIGHGDPAAVEPLVQVLNSTARSDYDNRVDAAMGLGRLGPVAAPAVRALTFALISGDSSLRYAAARALGKIGPGAKAAVPSLMDLWDDSHYLVRQQAVDAVQKIGPVALPALIAGLKNQNPDIRLGAAWQIGQFGGAGSSAVPELIEALHDSNPSVRAAALEALRKIPTRGARAAASKYRSRVTIKSRMIPGTVLTKKEIEAPIPPGDNHRNPLELAFEKVLQAPDNQSLLVTLHRGDNRADLLAFWKKDGSRYKLIRIFRGPAFGPDFGGFTPPKVFHYNGDTFVDVDLSFSGTSMQHQETILWIAPDLTLHNVRFQPAADLYKDKLKRGESIQDGEDDEFKNNNLTFSFGLWGPDDAHCCPTAGFVSGKFKLVGQKKYDAAKKKWSCNFSIIPYGYTRHPMSEYPR